MLLPRLDAWLDRGNAHFKESQQNLSKESQFRTSNILVYSIDLIRPSRQLGDVTTVYFFSQTQNLAKLDTPHLMSKRS